LARRSKIKKPERKNKKNYKQKKSPRRPQQTASKIQSNVLPTLKTPTMATATPNESQIHQMIQKVDDFLAGYPTLCQYGASDFI